MIQFIFVKWHKFMNIFVHIYKWFSLFAISICILKILLIHIICSIYYVIQFEIEFIKC